MTQTDVKMAWGKVGDQLSSLGLKLKLHAEQEFADEDDDDVSGALDRLAEAFDDAFETIANAAGDDAVKSDVRDAGRKFRDAVATTVNQATSGLRPKN